MLLLPIFVVVIVIVMVNIVATVSTMRGISAVLAIAVFADVEVVNIAVTVVGDAVFDHVVVAL